MKKIIITDDSFHILKKFDHELISFLQKLFIFIRNVIYSVLV